MAEEKKLLEIENLRKYFPVNGIKGPGVQAVQDVSLYIKKGETLGLVGESGCGKTTTGRTLLRLYEPTAGKIIYDDQVIFDGEKKIAVDMLPYRKKMQIVFQDPYASLDPRMTVADIIGEAIDIHKLAANKQERYDIIIFPGPEEFGQHPYYIKRISGMPGETVQIKDGKVYINDKELKSDVYGITDYIDYPGIAEEPITLGDDEYFCLGDNRPVSQDSRYKEVGPVKRSIIVGKVWIRIWPLTKFGKVS